jgi:signal transduction histidine kinase
MSERKNIFWILALLLIIIAPLVIIITPAFVSVTLSDPRYKIIFIPLSTSMVMYTLAFAIVIVWLCFMYFSKSLLINSATGVVAITGFIFIFSLGVQNYVYLHQDYIEYNPIWGSKEEYNWEELTNVTHEMYDQDTNRDEKYIFEFSDGYKFEFLVSGIMDYSVKSKIYNKLIKLDVPYKEY